MKVWDKTISEIEGYHTVTVGRDDDCDHGPC